MKRRIAAGLVLLLASIASDAGAWPRADAASAFRAAPGGWAARASDPFPEPGAAPDSSVDQFLEHLADSTSEYFGKAAAAIDTAGLDSALAYGLEHPLPRTRRSFRPSLAPDFAFNRVDGPVHGLGVRAPFPFRLGVVTAAGRYASGPNDWLWHARWAKEWGDRERPSWRAEIGGGLETGFMDHEHTSASLGTLRAFVAGTDRQHYLRREEFAVGLRHALPFAELGVRYRDADESAIATSAGWNLFHRALATFDNLAAWNGRAREVELAAVVNLQPFPAQLEVVHQTSGHAIGSDFEYRRTRIASSGNLGIGRWASLVPQFAYGRLVGQPVPQAAFYLGGSRSLRGLPAAARGGTGLLLARLDWIGADDMLAVLHVPHPAFLPVQLGVFAGAGAVWGPDSYGGPARAGGPQSSDWVTEAGLSAIYQPGIPDPTMVLRFNYAFPLGPERETTRFTVSFSKAIDFLQRFER